MRKKILHFLILLFPVLLCTKTAGQTIEDSLLEKVAYYEKMDSFERYYETYRDLILSYKADVNRHQLVTTSFDSTKIYRPPKTELEFEAFRHFIRLYLYSYRKQLGRSYSFLEIAKKYSTYVFDKSLLDEHSIYIENQIATGYAELDDYDNALYYYLKLVPGMKARSEDIQLARIYGNIADAYKWNNDLAKAKDYLGFALEIAVVTGDTLVYCSTYSRLLKIHCQDENWNDFRKIEEKYKNILSALDTTNVDVLLRKADLAATKSKAHFCLGQTIEALRQNQRSIDLGIRGNMEQRNISKLLAERAQMQITEGHIDGARISVEEAYKTLTSSTDSDEEGDLFLENTFVDIIKADIEIRKIQLDDSFIDSKLDTIWNLYRKAIAINEALNNEHAFSSSKFISSANTKKLVANAVTFAYDLYKTSPNSVVIEHLQSLLSFSKNLVLDEKLSSNIRYRELNPAEQSMVDSLTIEHNYLSQDNSQLAKKYEIKSKIKKLLSSPIYQIPEPKHTLRYIKAGEFYYLLTNLEGRSDFQKVGKVDSIENAVEEVLSEIQLESDLLASKALKYLSRTLLPGFVNNLPNSISIAPDGKLAVMPFSVLIKNNRYLITEHDIVYDRRRARKHSSETQLYCYSPTYRGDLAGVESKMVRTGNYALPNARIESIEISNLFSKSNVEFSTDFQSMISNIKEASIFHFAGHAAAYEDKSSMIIKTTDNVNLWLFEDIFQYVFDLDLVTISACESGRGTYSDGDGVQSIARGFMGAGASAVTYSLWTVNDRSTAEIMTKFYANLKKGMSKDRALSLAQRQFYADASPSFKHPYYWAGFVLAGDDSPLDHPVSHNRYVLLLFIAVAILFSIKTLLR